MVRHSILDKNVVVPDGAKVGVDVDLDSDLYTVSPGGITVVGKGVTIGKGQACQRCSTQLSAAARRRR